MNELVGPSAVVVGSIGFIVSLVINTLRVRNKKQPWPLPTIRNSPAEKAFTVMVSALTMGTFSAAAVAFIMVSYGLVLIPVALFGVLYWLFEE